MASTQGFTLRLIVATLLFFVVSIPALAAAQSVQIEGLIEEDAPDQKREGPASRPIMKGPPWLGVLLAEEYGQSGVGLDSVVANGPAESAGLKAGDRLTKIAGQPVNTQEQVKLYVRGHRAGDTISVTFRRGNDTKTAKVKLETLPDQQTLLKRQLLGRTAPNFKARPVGGSTDAKQVELRSFKGKPTIVEFWATWCGPCRKVGDDLKTLKKKYGDRVNILALSAEKSATIAKFAERFPAPYPRLRDPGRAAHNAYFIASFPTVILLDDDQKVAAVLLGLNAGASAEKKLTRLLDAD